MATEICGQAFCHGPMMVEWVWIMRHDTVIPYNFDLKSAQTAQLRRQLVQVVSGQKVVYEASMNLEGEKDWCCFVTV